PKVDLDHPVDDRNQQEQAGPLRLREQSAEPEDDPALVLAGDFDRREPEQDDQYQDDDDDDDGRGHVVTLHGRGGFHPPDDELEAVQGDNPDVLATGGPVSD